MNVVRLPASETRRWHHSFAVGNSPRHARLKACSSQSPSSASPTRCWGCICGWLSGTRAKNVSNNNDNTTTNNNNNNNNNNNINNNNNNNNDNIFCDRPYLWSNCEWYKGINGLNTVPLIYSLILFQNSPISAPLVYILLASSHNGPVIYLVNWMIGSIHEILYYS